MGHPIVRPNSCSNAGTSTETATGEHQPGGTITEFADTRPAAPPDGSVAVCQAVQHAHQKGIIHRDLKPGNVMVTELDGRPRPKVIDLGVAKATEFKLTDQSLADAGAIVGTPTSMSPEQVDPSSMDNDTRTDVYALGVILYELLDGSPPLDAKQFQRGALLEMLRMVRVVDPPRPSTKVSTAEALPNIAGTTWGLIRADRARAGEARRIAERDEALKKAAGRADERDLAIKTANDRADDLKHRLGVCQMVLAGIAYDAGDVVLAAERLDNVPPGLRGWDWGYWKQQTRGGLFTLYGHTGAVSSMSFSPDGSRIVTGSRDRTAKVWDARTGQELKGELMPLETRSSPISPDGRSIAHAVGNRVELIALNPDTEELDYRRFLTRPDLTRYREGYEAAKKIGNEKQASSAKDWRVAAGMFTGREFSKIVDEEGRKIREADREEARQEFGE